VSSAPRPPREASATLGALALFAVLLTLWELWVAVLPAPPLYLPPPTRVARRLIDALAHGDLLADVAMTLRRLALGAALGGLPALALGLAMGWSRRLRRVVDPLVAAVHPLPKVALLPLLLLVFGVGESSRLVLVAVGAFFPMLVGAMAGVREIPPAHFEVARSCGARRLLVLRRIVLPGSLPLLLASARLSLNAALVAVLVAELLTARDGLGERLWFAWQTLKVDELYATTAVVALLGLSLQGALDLLARRLLPWRDESAPAR
jgi:NitT/TauT family transport system permease protein